ncbi:MAG: hypothetical protein M3Q23_06385 [Actinomycetota bacterium]|nr:hypothetical protein [Actinomycetota bacterium]
MAAIFYLALALWIVMTVVTILSPSSATAKAAGVFGILSLGAFFGLLGGLIIARVESIRGGSGHSPEGGYQG